MKRFTTILLALVMILSLSLTAFAADSTVTYQGQEAGFTFAPGSEYTESDLFDSFKNVMPGDTLIETVTIANQAEDSDFIKVYMRAVSHDETANPLSPNVSASGETVASMSEFLSQLSMQVYNGDTLIYDASPEKTDGLTENVYLCTLRTGETSQLRVELSVPIDLDNKFANRVGEVDWVFVVEAFNESQLTVRKIWSDGNSNHSDESISVNLLKDGKVERTQELNAENGWTFTFDKLVEGYEWTVEEAKVPEGYTVGYDIDGTTTTITNTFIEPTPTEPTPTEPTPTEPAPTGDPLDITVKKVWADSSKDHPDSVNVTLYNGKTAVETVKLSADNNWTHSWKDSKRLGNWQVLETSIPQGYTPSYAVKDGVVTITNTAVLIKTGQLNWPILALGGCGLLLIVSGVCMSVNRKKKQDA